MIGKSVAARVSCHAFLMPKNLQQNNPRLVEARKREKKQ
jgi:hypothetical protein